MLDYQTLLGFPIEIVALAIICYTLVQVVTLIVNRKKDKIEISHEDKQSPE